MEACASTYAWMRLSHTLGSVYLSFSLSLSNLDHNFSTRRYTKVCYSYGELMGAATAVAHFMQRELGVRPGDRVGVLLAG